MEFATLFAQELAAIDEAVKLKNGTKILAVTVLTSMDQEDVRRAWLTDAPIQELVVNQAGLALLQGCDGVIASGHEAATLREKFGDGIVVVVPGIRGEKDADDQKRTVNVEEAFAAGADYIVVGRPIRKAEDPRAAALAIQARIAACFS